MRHRKSGFTLDGTLSHRKADLRNLATSLFDFERIRTTTTRAKAVRRLVDRLVTMAKDGSLSSRRHAAQYIYAPRILKKLFDELAPCFQSRSGGYTRILSLGFRKGDGASISMIELVMDKSARPKVEVKETSEEAKGEAAKGEKKEKPKKEKIAKKAKEVEAKKEKKESKKKETKEAAEDKSKKMPKKERRASPMAKAASKVNAKLKKSTTSQKKGS